MRNALKWLGAAVVMVFLAVITIPFALDALQQSIVIGGEGESDGSVDPGAPGGTEGQVEPVADFSVRGDAVRQAGEPLIAIGGAGGDGVVFAFPAIDQPVDCLTEVTLELTYDGDTGGSAIAVPASVDDPEALSNDDALPEDLYSASPQASASLEEPGRVSWTVTEIYRAQLVGAPDSATFTVAVVVAEVDRDRRLRFASSEGPEGDRPLLRWSADPTCPGGS